METIRSILLFCKKPKRTELLVLLAVTLWYSVFFTVHATGHIPLPAWSLVCFGIVGLSLLLLPSSVSMKYLVAMLPMEGILFTTGISGTELRPYQIASIIAFCAVLRDWKSHIRPLFPAPNPLVDVGAVLFIVGGFLSSLFSLHIAESVRLSVILLSCGLLYFLARWHIRSWKDLQQYIPYIFFPLFLVSIYTLFQNVLFNAGVLNNTVMTARPHGTFSEPDWLGGYLAFGISIIVFAYSRVRKTFWLESRAIQARFLLVDVGFFACVALILTVSRSAWLALAAAGVALIFVITRRQNHYAFGEAFRTIGILLLILFGALGVVQWFHLSRFDLSERLESSATGMQTITIACPQGTSAPTSIETLQQLQVVGCQHISLEEKDSFRSQGFLVTTTHRPDPNTNIRLHLWRATIDVLKNNALFGIGWGSIGPILGVDGRGTALNTSNLLLEAYAGAGLLGFIGMTLVFSSIGIRSFVRVIMGIAQPQHEAILVTLVAVVVFNLLNAGEFLGFLWVWMGVSSSLLPSRS